MLVDAVALHGLIAEQVLPQALYGFKGSGEVERVTAGIHHPGHNLPQDDADRQAGENAGSTKRMELPCRTGHSKRSPERARRQLSLQLSGEVSLVHVLSFGVQIRQIRMHVQKGVCMRVFDTQGQLIPYAQPI